MATAKETTEKGRSGRPSMRLTKDVLESLSPEGKPYLVRDDKIKGLVVKVYPTGTKTFFLNVRVGLTVDMFKIGQWP